MDFNLNVDTEEGPKEEMLTVVKADLVTEKEGFQWKGHAALTVRMNEVKIPLGFQPQSVIQITPPASINSLGFSAEWNLMAAGTAHGLVVYDCLQNSTITTKCTLNAQGKK